MDLEWNYDTIAERSKIHNLAFISKCLHSHHNYNFEIMVIFILILPLQVIYFYKNLKFTSIWVIILNILGSKSDFNTLFLRRGGERRGGSPYLYLLPPTLVNWILFLVAHPLENDIFKCNSTSVPGSVSPLPWIIHRTHCEHFTLELLSTKKNVLIAPVIDSELCGGSKSSERQCVSGLWTNLTNKCKCIIFKNTILSSEKG